MLEKQLNELIYMIIMKKGASLMTNVEYEIFLTIVKLISKEKYVAKKTSSQSNWFMLLIRMFYKQDILHKHRL